MKTRITALLLCFVVALGLMAGCSSEKPAAEPAAPASTAEPAPPQTAKYPIPIPATIPTQVVITKFT